MLSSFTFFTYSRSHENHLTIHDVSDSTQPNAAKGQGLGEYYSGTCPAQNDKHKYTKNFVLEYYSSTDFPVLVLRFSVLAATLAGAHLNIKMSSYQYSYSH